MLLSIIFESCKSREDLCLSLHIANQCGQRELCCEPGPGHLVTLAKIH